MQWFVPLFANCYYMLMVSHLVNGFAVHISVSFHSNNFPYFEISNKRCNMTLQNNNCVMYTLHKN